MTIETIGNKIIKYIKAFPEEARQSQEDSGPLTFWDEYKEQMQFEEYDSFEVFQETINGMVEAYIEELSDKEITKIYNQGHTSRYSIELLEMREIIRSRVLLYIEEEASDQEIEYRKPEIDFIRYFEYDLMIVAKILKQVGPCDYIIHAYSEATSSDGEKGQVDITTLDEENAMERISEEEFEREKKILTEFNEDDKDLTEVQRAIKKIDYKLQQSWIDEKPIKNKIDQELFQAGLILSGYHIEAGARKFDQYAKAMIKDLGYSAIPYVKFFYNAIRDWPGFDSKGMDTNEQVELQIIEKIVSDI